MHPALGQQHQHNKKATQGKQGKKRAAAPTHAQDRPHGAQPQPQTTAPKQQHTTHQQPQHPQSYRTPNASEAQHHAAARPAIVTPATAPHMQRQHHTAPRRNTPSNRNICKGANTSRATPQQHSTPARQLSRKKQYFFASQQKQDIRTNVE